MKTIENVLIQLSETKRNEMRWTHSRSVNMLNVQQCNWAMKHVEYFWIFVFVFFGYCCGGCDNWCYCLSLWQRKRRVEGERERKQWPNLTYDLIKLYVCISHFVMRSLLLIRNNSKLFRVYLLHALIPFKLLYLLHHWRVNVSNWFCFCLFHFFRANHLSLRNDLVHSFMHFILNGWKTMSNYIGIILKYYDGWLSPGSVRVNIQYSHLTQVPYIICISQILILLLFITCVVFCWCCCCCCCFFVNIVFHSIELSCTVRASISIIASFVSCIVFHYQLIQRRIVHLFFVSMLPCVHSEKRPFQLRGWWLALNCCFAQNILFSSLQNSDFKNIVSDQLIHFGLCFAIAISYFAQTQIEIGSFMRWRQTLNETCVAKRRKNTQKAKVRGEHIMGEGKQ